MNWNFDKHIMALEFILWCIALWFVLDIISKLQGIYYIYKSWVQ